MAQLDTSITTTADFTRLQLEGLLDMMHEGVVIQDETGRIVAWNNAAERMLGLTGDQLAGRTSYDPTWQAVDRDLNPWPGEAHPATVTLRTGKPVDGVIMGVNRPDGSRTWMRVTARQLREGSTVRGVVVTFADITEQVRSEEEQRRTVVRAETLLAHISDAVILVDGEGILRFASESTARVLGLQPSDWVGRPVWELIHESDLPLAMEALANTSRDPGTKQPLELRIRNALDEWVPMEVVANNMLDVDDIAGIVIVARDISERNELAAAGRSMERVREVALLREQLAELHRFESISKLMAGVAHDVNSYLGVIRNSVHALDQDLPPDPALHAPVEVIDEAVGRAADLLSATLDAGRSTVADRTIDCAADDVVGEMFRLLTRVMPRRIHLQLRLGVPGARITPSPSSLERVVINLVCNAVAAIDAEGAIELCTTQRNDGVELTVTDTGRGMSEWEAAHYVGDMRSGRPGVGTGLGLTSVSRLVADAGGSMGMESTPGEGTRVWLWFPRSVADTG